MAIVVDCSLEINEFELYLRYYIHFWTNASWEKYEPPLSTYK